MKKSRLLGAVCACITAISFNANAALILDVGPGGSADPCGGCDNTNGDTFGWAFDVADTITVDGIGVWDAGSDGIGPAVGVGLWVDGGALLASTTISNASTPKASNGAGVWLFEDIASLVLTPGRYVLGSVFYAGTPLAQFGTAFTTIPEVTYIEGRRDDLGGLGLSRPDNLFGGGDGVFGSTLRISAVPVPAAVWLFGSGLLGLIGVARRRKTA